jgi:putative ABC transport system permease protein
MLVKYSSPNNLESVTEFVREKWLTAAPGVPFESITLDNFFNDVLQGDKTAEMTGTLGALAVLLSCLGLFGLSNYSVERRIKEIGIRKVLGASVAKIVKMLTKDFIKLVAIANIIAMPIAYFMMNAINNFIYAYPIKIKADIFFLTAGLTLLIAFLTVASQTIKSALANPVNSLKYE